MGLYPRLVFSGALFNSWNKLWTCWQTGSGHENPSYLKILDVAVWHNLTVQNSALKIADHYYK